MSETLCGFDLGAAENLMHFIQTTSGVDPKAGEAVAQVIDADIGPRPPLGRPQNRAKTRRLSVVACSRGLGARANHNRLQAMIYTNRYAPDRRNGLIFSGGSCDAQGAAAKSGAKGFRKPLDRTRFLTVTKKAMKRRTDIADRLRRVRTAKSTGK